MKNRNKTKATNEHITNQQRSWKTTQFYRLMDSMRFRLNFIAIFIRINQQQNVCLIFFLFILTDFNWIENENPASIQHYTNEINLYIEYDYFFFFITIRQLNNVSFVVEIWIRSMSVGFNVEFVNAV